MTVSPEVSYEGCSRGMGWMACCYGPFNHCILGVHAASSKSHSQIGLDSNRAAPCHQEGNDRWTDGSRQCQHLNSKI